MTARPSIFDSLKGELLMPWADRLGLKGIRGRRNSFGCPVGGQSSKGGIRLAGDQWYCHVCEIGGGGVPSLVGHVVGMSGSQLAAELERMSDSAGVVRVPDVGHAPVVAAPAAVVERRTWAGRELRLAFREDRHPDIAAWLLKHRGVDWYGAPVGWLREGEVEQRVAAYAPGPCWPLFDLLKPDAVANMVIRASEPRAEAEVKYMPLHVGDGSMQGADGWPLVYQVPAKGTVCLLAEGAMDSLICAGIAGGMQGVSVAGARCAGDIVRVAEACMTVVGVSRLILLPHKDHAHAGARGGLKAGAGPAACAQVLERWTNARMVGVPEGGDVNDCLRAMGLEGLRAWVVDVVGGAA